MRGFVYDLLSISYLISTQASCLPGLVLLYTLAHEAQYNIHHILPIPGYQLLVEESSAVAADLDIASLLEEFSDIFN
jgi:hypothetical protein